MLDVLERTGDFRSGASRTESRALNTLEGDYGTGKTQFIQCLAERHTGIRWSRPLVTIGRRVPFNLTAGDLQGRDRRRSFLPQVRTIQSVPSKGIESACSDGWIRAGSSERWGHAGRLRCHATGSTYRPFGRLRALLGSVLPDTQMATGLQASRAAPGLRSNAAAAVQRFRQPT